MGLDGGLWVCVSLGALCVCVCQCVPGRRCGCTLQDFLASDTGQLLQKVPRVSALDVGVLGSEGRGAWREMLFASNSASKDYF